MKQWLVTGVGSGFGHAIAQAALQRGDIVFGSVRTTDAAEGFQALAPGRAFALRMDVTDATTVAETLSALVSRHGAPDVLVNNAGYGLVGGVEETSIDEVRSQFEVNVFGALRVMQALLPAMRARGSGMLVNISSVSGLVGWPSLGIYSGSKFALEGICETLAHEVAPFGLRVMLVEPGGFRTDFAGRSRVRTSQPLSDYAGTVLDDCKQILADHAGHERGDPARAAEAIINAIEAEQPPLRLLLGADALGYVLERNGRQQAETARWLDTTTSTDFVSC